MNKREDGGVMFKRVQMKFFAIITSILLALFIAVLVSINLIMEAVMQHQSQVVLRQIAANIEYDDVTSTFMYFSQPEENMPPPKENQQQTTPEKPSENNRTEKPSADQPTEEKTTAAEQPTQSAQNKTEAPTSAQTTTAEVTTAPVHTQKPTQTQTTTAVSPGTVPQATTTKKPQETKPVQTKPHVEGTRPQVTTPQVKPPFLEEPSYEGPLPPPWWFGNGYPWFPGADINSDEKPFEDNTHNSEETAAEAFGSVAADEPELAPVSADDTPVLSGYTILTEKNPGIMKLAVDNASARRDASMVPKSLGSIDFFVLMADHSGKFLASLNNEELEDDEAQTYISAIFDDGATSGMLNSLQFCCLDKENGTVIVFTDKSAELEMLDQLTRTTILIGIISFVILSVLAYFFSKKSIQPIKLAFEKQKQFISDAGHELKTPLTVISANADVLSEEIGQNKWLMYIKAQTERMNVLVNDLLSLTRLENNSADFVFGEIDLSKVVENTALPFECRAFEENRHFEIDIENGLTINGSEKHIRQMTAIFIDNALKYSCENGIVKVTLSSQGDKKLLSVFNTGKGISDSEKDKIFERFYRSDDSRSRQATGGYGLGLAIAKSIIDRHKFRVNVDNHEGESICFTVIMQ